MANKGTFAATCATEAVYTGACQCDRSEGKTVGLAITPVSASFSDTEATFLSEFAAAVSSDTDRMTPIHNIIGTTINGGDINAPDQGGYGGPKPIGLNPRQETFQIDAGDCMWKELMKMNGWRVRVFRYDDQGYLFGTIVNEGGTDKRAGFEARVWVNRVRTDGSTPNNLSITVYYSTNLEREEANAFSVQLPNGLPAGLTGASTQSRAARMAVMTNSGEDITSVYAEDWAPEMFVDESGASAEAVAYDPETETLDVAPAGNYRLAKASTLEAGGISGLEGEPVYAKVGEK